MSNGTVELIAAASEIKGELIPLGSQSQGLYLEVRRARNPFNDLSVNANQDYHGWIADPMDSILVVDLYSHSQGIKPIGRIDWEINDVRANGSNNVHAGFLTTAIHEQLSQERWPEFQSHAFDVDEAFQKRGLGSLLLAVSGVVLPQVNVKEFTGGFLLGPAGNTYRRFGIDAHEFKNKDESTAYIPIERLSNHPYSQEIMESFAE